MLGVQILMARLAAQWKLFTLLDSSVLRIRLSRLMLVQTTVALLMLIRGYTAAVKMMKANLGLAITKTNNNQCLSHRRSSK